MLLYVMRRLLTAIPTLFVIVTIAFFLIRIAPGGPFNQERGLSPEVKANLEAQFGLGDPLWLQYANYLKNLLHGNFGPSYNLPDFTVTELFASGLPISNSARHFRPDPGPHDREYARHHCCPQSEQGRRLYRHRPCDRGQHHPDLRHCAGDPASVRPDMETSADRRLGRWGLGQQDRPDPHASPAANGGRRPPYAWLDDRVRCVLTIYGPRGPLACPIGRWW